MNSNNKSLCHAVREKPAAHALAAMRQCAGAIAARQAGGEGAL